MVAKGTSVRGGDILSPKFQMAAKTAIIQIYPVLSPLPLPGKTVPQVPSGGYTEQQSAKSMRMWLMGVHVSKCKVGQGNRVCFWSHTGTACKCVPKTQARRPSHLPPNILPSALHHDPP